ncbi:MGMT family protein [Patescibacteria group bacterium]|jgi:alkylated DNA nucleotide flippase Atl1|nr:MGMT family protein [Patescibacteria group bacterium]
MKAEIMEIMTWIPYGRVTTYGHVAELLDIHYGMKTSGRMVGKILS